MLTRQLLPFASEGVQLDPQCHPRTHTSSSATPPPPKHPPNCVVKVTEEVSWERRRVDLLGNVAGRATEQQSVTSGPLETHTAYNNVSSKVKRTANLTEHATLFISGFASHGYTQTRQKKERSRCLKDSRGKYKFGPIYYQRSRLVCKRQVGKNKTEVIFSTH